MKEFLPSVVFAVVIASGFATEFPSTSGDISSTGEDGWNGPIPTDAASFTKSGTCTYVCSKDVSFWSWQMGNRDQVLTFDLGESEVSLTRGNNWDFQTVGPASTVTIAGGTINFANNGKMSLCSGSFTRDCRLTFDGTKILKASTVTPISSADGRNSSVVFTNSAAASVYQLTADAYGGYNNAIEVNAGCVVTASSHVRTDVAVHAADPSLCGNRLIVRGTGAMVKTGSSANLAVGVAQSSNSVLVANGGKIECCQVHLGEAANVRGNAIRVMDGGTLTTADDVYVGKGGAEDSEFLVSNATLSCGWQFLMGSDTARNSRFVLSGPFALASVPCFRPGSSPDAEGNVIRVEDGASLQCGTIQIGHGGGCVDMTVSDSLISASDAFVIGELATASECSLRMFGPKALFACATLDNSDFFGRGGRGLFEIAGCSTNDLNVALSYVGRTSDGNRMVLRDGATWRQTSATFHVGAFATNELVTDTSSNVLRIATGAQMSLYKLCVNGTDNGVVISNGTLSVSRMYDADDVQLGCLGADDLDVGARGAYIRFEGDTPRLVAVNASVSGVKARNASKLQFVLPETPCAAAPVTCSKVDMDSTCSIEVDVSAPAGQKDHGSLVYPLIDAGGNPMLDAAVLEAANARLAGQGARLYWKNAEGGRKTLECRIRGDRGLMIILR